MFVQMWMTQELVTIAPTEPLADADPRMARHRIRRLPVVEPGAHGKLVGIVSVSDILRASPPDLDPFSAVARDALDARARGAGRRPDTIADVMHTDLHTTTPDAPIEDAARCLRDHKIGALPVVRGECLVGLITESDIFRALTALLDAHDSARITFDLSRDEDPFPFVVAPAERHQLRVHSFNTSRHHERPVCVVQVVGPPARVDAMLDELWTPRHRVLHVAKTR